MRRKTVICAMLFVCFTAYADQRYTRDQLERMSHSRLVDIILDLQGGSSGTKDCLTINPLADERPRIMTVVNSGYTDNGTLKWPNGQKFMLRSGYNNDRTLYFPNGQTMRLANGGYTNDGIMYWPNGKMMLDRNGYNTSGTIYRDDGSVWLRRNSGYTNDRERIGVPVHSYNAGDFQVNGRLTNADGVIAKTFLRGDLWSIEVVIDSDDQSVRVTECFDH